MDRFTQIVVAVVFSVLLSVVAVVSGATGALQSMFGTGESAPAPAPAGKQAQADDSAVDDLKAELANLREKMENLPAALPADPDKVVVPASSGSDEALKGRVNELETQNAKLKKDIETLQAYVASLAAGAAEGGSLPAIEGVESGSPGFAAAVESVIEARQARIRAEQRAEEEVERLAGVERQKEAALQRVPRIADFIAERGNLDEMQKEMVTEALLAAENKRIDMDFQAWKEEWDRDKRREAQESLWQETAASLQSAGLPEEQVQQMQRMVGGGGGRGGFAPGGAGGFGGRGGQGGQGGGGFGGRGGR